MDVDVDVDGKKVVETGMEADEGGVDVEVISSFLLFFADCADSAPHCTAGSALPYEKLHYPLASFIFDFRILYSIFIAIYK